MTTQSDPTLRRVVVALDAAADFEPMIEMAAAMAADLGARLSALFIQDEGLLRLAGLPFAQQLDPVTALRSPIDKVGLSAQLSLIERRMRQELRRIASLHNLPWSFETLQASIGPEALQLTEDEMLVVVAATRPVASGLRVESAWWGLVGQIRQPLLLVPERPEPAGPIAVLYEATEPGRRALAASRQIAQAGRRPLIVVLSGGSTSARIAEVEALAQGNEGKITVHLMEPPYHEALRALVQSARATLLVIGRDGMTTNESVDLLRLSRSSALMVV